MKGHRVACLCASLVLVLNTLAVSAQEIPDPAELLLRASHCDITNGDLAEAIRLYQLLINEYPDRDAEVAEALFRLGWCQERTGDPEAVNNYRRVYFNYQGLNVWADQAYARLSQIPGGLAEGSGSNGPVKIAEFGFDVSIPSLSDDARYMTFVNPATGDLALLDFDSGDKRYLTHSRGLLPGGSGAHAVTSRMSPDNQFVAYTWFNLEGQCELRFVNLQNQTELVLFSDPAYLYVQPGDWSRDGESIVGYSVRASDQVSVIMEFSISGEQSEHLLELPEGPPMTLKYSPDEQYLAYDEAEHIREIWADVRILDISGEVPLQEITDPQHLYLLDWTTDGSRIVYSSEQSLVPAMHSVEITGGMVSSGSTELFRQQGRIRPAGYATDGALYFFHQLVNDVTVVNPDWIEIPAAWIPRWASYRAEEELFQTEQDFGSLDVLAYSRDGSAFFSSRNRESQVSHVGTGRRQGDQEAPETLLNISFPIDPAPFWSPDDTLLAYLSPPEIIHWFDAPDNLIIRNRSTGETIAIPLSFSPRSRELIWLDEKTVAIPGADSDGNEGLYTVDIISDSEALMVPVVVAGLHHFVALRDRNHLLCIQADYEHNIHSLIDLDLETGIQHEIYTSPDPLGPFSLSPDGTSVALTESIASDVSYTGSCRIVHLPLGGGDPRIVRVLPVHQPLELLWIDSETISLILSRHEINRGFMPAQLTSEQWIISTIGGSVEVSALDISGLTAYRSSSDGASAVIITRASGSYQELWRAVFPPTSTPEQ